MPQALILLDFLPRRIEVKVHQENPKTRTAIHRTTAICSASVTNLSPLIRRAAIIDWFATQFAARNYNLGNTRSHPENKKAFRDWSQR